MMLYNHDAMEPWDEPELEPLERPDMLAARAEFVGWLRAELRAGAWHNPPEGLLFADLFVADTVPEGCLSRRPAKVYEFYKRTSCWSHVLRALADAIEAETHG